MVENIYNQPQQYEPLKLSNDKHLNIEMTTTEADCNLGMFLLKITFTINIL
jgi:hypothetical protein